MEVDRAGRFREGERECLRDRSDNLRRVAYRDGDLRLDDGSHKGGDVEFVDGEPAFEGFGHGGGNQDERHTIALGDKSGGGEIRRAGAGDDEADTGLTRRAGVAIRREARCPFMPRDDWADGRMVMEQIVRQERMHAGDAEEMRDILCREGVNSAAAPVEVLVVTVAPSFRTSYRFTCGKS